MDSHTAGPQHLYDQVRQQLRVQTDRPAAVRGAIYACRKGERCSPSASSPVSATSSPGSGDEQRADPARRPAARARYIPEILERMSRGEEKAERLATHVMPLDDGPKGYRMCKSKEVGCVRAVFRPGA